jgi:hypothetical protein
MRQLLFVVALGLTACGPSTEVRSLRAVQSSPLLSGDPAVEIELYDARGFQLVEGKGILVIGSAEFCIRRYAETGSEGVIFTLPRQDFDDLRSGDSIWFQEGRGTGWPRRGFGTLDKRRLSE